MLCLYVEQNLIRRCQGIIDLTWDNPQRSDNFRTLALAKLSGADGILRVNSDLANNKADQLIIGGEGTLSSLKVGGTAKLGTKTNAYLQLEKMTGGIGSDLMCNVGLRYNF